MWRKFLEKNLQVPMLSFFLFSLPGFNPFGAQYFSSPIYSQHPVTAGEVLHRDDPAHFGLPADLPELASGGVCRVSLGAVVLFVRPGF